MTLQILAAGACGLTLATAVIVVLCGRLPRVRCARVAGGSRRGVRQTAVAVVLGAGAWQATGWPVAGPVVAAAVLGLPRVLAPVEAREAIVRGEAVATWTRRVADLLASGAGGLEQAIRRSADTAPDPIAEPVRALARQMRLHGTETALRAFADELADPAADAVVLALLLRVRTGGRGLAELLHAQATTQAEQVRARRQVEADRAKPRTTVRCLLAIVAAMLAGLFACAADYLTPFSTPAGQLVLACLAVFAAAAVVWMHRLTTPPAADRVLHTLPPKESGR